MKKKTGLFIKHIILFTVLIFPGIFPNYDEKLKRISNRIPIDISDTNDNNIVPKIIIRAKSNSKFVTVSYKPDHLVSAEKFWAGIDESFIIEYIDDERVALKSCSKNKYLCVDLGSSLNEPPYLRANQDEIGDWETFDMIDLGGNELALKSHANDKYVCADIGPGHDWVPNLVANRDAIGDWETFELIPANKAPQNAPIIGIKSIFNDKFIGFTENIEENVVSATHSNLTTSGSFYLIREGGDRVILQSLENNLYLTNEISHNSELRLNQDNVDTISSQVFDMIKQNGNCFVFRSLANEKYVSVDPSNNKLIANKSVFGNDEQFEIIVVNGTLNTTSFFIAPNGNDQNPGTINSPFKTLVQARNTLRGLKINGTFPSTGVTVYLRDGIYALNETFELNESDSGFNDGKVIYRAYQDEDVRVMGGREISPNSVSLVTNSSILHRIVNPSARNNIHQVDLKSLGLHDYGTLKPFGFRRDVVPTAMEFFFNDRPMKRARWPNVGTFQITGVVDNGHIGNISNPLGTGGTFQYDEERPVHWSQAENMWISGFPGFGWAQDSIKIDTINHSSREIHLDSWHMFGFQTGYQNQLYVYNLIEELDYPGEYYIDENSGILYFYAPSDISSARMSVSILEEPLVAMEGTSLVTFEKLTFEVSRGIGIYIERGSDNLILNSKIRNIGNVGVCIGRGAENDAVYQHPPHNPDYTKESISRSLGGLFNWLYSNSTFNRHAGSGHGVESCDIFYTGAGGVSLGGGDRITLTPGRNYVENCHIYEFNRLDPSYKGAVNLDGVGNIVRKNLIHQTNQMAIFLNGNEHLVELNEIHHTSQMADDNGGCYLGRDPSERDNVFRHNFFHHQGQDKGMITCIYNDDGACGTIMHGNIFYKSSVGEGALYYAGGNDLRAENNIFIECEYALGTRFNFWAPVPEEGDIFYYRLDKVNFQEAPWSIEYPEMVSYFDDNPYYPTRNVFSRNLCYRTPRVYHGDESFLNNITRENNVILDEDPGFRNYNELDFAITSYDLIHTKIPDFDPIHFDEMGLSLGKDRRALRHHAPDFIPLINEIDTILENKVSILKRGSGDIYYTLDGTTPDATSKKYNGPITLRESTIIKAVIIGNGKLPSPIVEKPYKMHKNMIHLDENEVFMYFLFFPVSILVTGQVLVWFRNARKRQQRAKKSY